MNSSASELRQRAAAQRRRLADVLQRGPQPRPHRVPARLLDVRVQVEEQRAADQEGADVDEQRGRRAGGRDDAPAEGGSEHEGRSRRRCSGRRWPCARPRSASRAPLLAGACSARAARPTCSRAARATSARSSALAARAAVPSRAASTRTAGSEKCHMSTASAAVTTASKRYRALSSPLRLDASTRATRAGTTNAGSACPANSSADDRERAVGVVEHRQHQGDAARTSLPSRLTVYAQRRSCAAAAIER